MKFLKLIMYYFIVSCTAIILGTIGWFFLFSVNHLLHFLWLGYGEEYGFLLKNPILLFPFLWLGAILTAFIYNNFGKYPKPGVMYAKEYEENKRVRYDKLIGIYFVSMIPLILGSSIGPEAALVGIFFMSSTLINDFISYFEQKWEIRLVTQKEEKFHKRLLHNKLYLIKILLIYIITAWTLITLLNYDEFPAFYIKLAKVNLTVNEIIYFIPLLFSGYALAMFYKKSEHFIEHNFAKIQSIYLKLFITTTIIGIVALSLPILILSGEGTLHMLVDEKLLLYSSFVYILLAFGKIILTHVCISGDLKGGHIFPIIFSSFLLGIGLAYTFNIDITFAIVVVTISTTLTIFSKSLGVFLLLALFFPAPILIIVFIVVLILRERIANANNEKEL